MPQPLSSSAPPNTTCPSTNIPDAHRHAGARGVGLFFCPDRIESGPRPNAQPTSEHPAFRADRDDAPVADGCRVSAERRHPPRRAAARLLTSRRIERHADPCLSRDVHGAQLRLAKIAHHATHSNRPSHGQDAKIEVEVVMNVSRRRVVGQVQPLGNRWSLRPRPVRRCNPLARTYFSVVPTWTPDTPCERGWLRTGWQKATNRALRLVYLLGPRHRRR